MLAPSQFSLLAATRHIGWGGVGKLRLILDKLKSARIAIHGDEHVVAITKEFLGADHNFEEQKQAQFDVALVINDPTVANGIADLNVPVVYVDSLLYLHRTESDVPDLTRIACYCAQKYPIDRFPLTSSSLRAYNHIRWIDPIVPEPQRRCGGRGIVINVGGLYTYNVAGIPSEVVNRAVDAYLKLVLFPLVDVLQRSGRTISAICGNIDAETCGQLRTKVAQNVAVGPQHPHAFQSILADADLLITSPGSTTILQAMAINLPTLFLPPQNRSQFFNAKVYSKSDADTMQWPDEVLDATKIEDLRSEGLGALNSYIYGSIIAAADSEDLRKRISKIITKTVNQAPEDGVLTPRLSNLGQAGAEQVAQLVQQIALRKPETKTSSGKHV
jgi:hydroxymethylcytosylglucuronate/cytosylglucuronate synthase